VASSGSAVCVVPADYRELALVYGPEIKSMVWKQLGAYAQPADVEDGVQYIMERFKHNNVIAQYDPAVVSSYNGRPVTFAAFIKAKIALYCRGLREGLKRRSGRELLVVDTPPGESDAPRWIDALAGQADDYPSLSDSEVLERLRDGLGRCAPPAGGPSLVSIFDAMAVRHAEGRPMTAHAMRKQLGAESTAQADAWLADLREALRVVASPKRYEVGGMLLSAGEVRAAIDALKGSRGNRVLPAFADSGHPLAEAGRDWYLKFAADTRAKYPECRVGKGGHYEGGHYGGVKAQLIYGLEMLIGAEPAPVAQDEERRAWAALAALIGRLPGASPDKTETILELARMVLAEDAPAAA
jgi:hypothetical protein